MVHDGPVAQSLSLRELYLPAFLYIKSRKGQQKLPKKPSGKKDAKKKGGQSG
jgi:hypothetical protein